MSNVTIKLYHRGMDRNITTELEEGDPLFIESGGPHEEGYSYTNELYELEEGVVYYESHTRSKDCDGRLDENIECIWPVNGKLNENGFPVWENQTRNQRDYTAKVMNY